MPFAFQIHFRLRQAATSTLLPCWAIGLFLSTAMAQPGQRETDADLLRDDFKQLIESENRHDLRAVQALLLDSPSTLFVAKSPDGWRGYWGKDDVTHHFGELYKKPFRIDADYATEKIVLLTPVVAETYVNAKIKADYGGFVEPAPFVMVLVWVKSSGRWKMATDIPIPIPHEATTQSELK